MKLKENLIYKMDWLKGAKNIPNKSINLIIADPPYFRIKGSFDFLWNNFEEYLKDVTKWAKECKRILSENGTILWYGHAKNIAHTQVIFDQYFKLVNNLVWNKGLFMGLEKSKSLRSFAPCTERILFYSNENNQTGLEKIKFDVENFKPLRDYFEGVQKKLNLPKKSFIEKIGQSADHCFRWGSSQWEMPTESTYNQLIEMFRIDLLEGFKTYEELRHTYEELRHTYEELRRPFFNIFQLNEVLNFPNESSKTGAKYKHPTVKPEELTKVLIKTCSRENDLILIPFAGSGTECAVAAKNNRRFIGFDINEKYVEISNERVSSLLK